MAERMTVNHEERVQFPPATPFFFKDMEAADAARYLLRDAKRMAEAMKEIACDLDDLQGNSYAVHMGALRAEKEATA